MRVRKYWIVVRISISHSAKRKKKEQARRNGKENPT
jgi:hypothetical protein